MKQIAMLDSQVIRAALLALLGLAGLIASFFGVDEAMFSEKGQKVVDAVLLVITTGSVLWAGYARATKPTPPITDAAVAKTAELVRKEGGFARAGALGMLLAAALSVGACGVLLPVAKTWNERLASGYSTVTAVREATSAWVDAKVGEAQSLPEAERTPFLAAVRKDAENVQRQADQAREGLDIARSLHGLDVKTAEARLLSTIRILEALQSYLEGR